ncbi:MAG TPA: ATP-dependent DNA ligase [Verrucomicrobiales bacterium]|nr:ATP-dependent DNA ligase [Verrucomicrobiales bacterium]
MKRFAQLFHELDGTTRTSEKLAALERYFRDAPPADAAWALHFLLGRRGRRPVTSTRLREWTAEASGLPFWLVEESYEAVGDLAETIALLLEGRIHPPNPASVAAEAAVPAAPEFRELVTGHLQPLADLSEAEQRASLFATLATLDQTGRFLFLKLLTGGFRLGVSRTLVVRALAAVAGLDRAVMEHRLLGSWQPTAGDFQRLVATDSNGDPARPYPFYLASPIEQNTDPITDSAGWLAEWKWDGIRAQLIRRAGQTILWSRGEEVITPGYPEIVEATAALPDGTVLDGELLGWRGGTPLPFNELQKRLGRKAVPAKVRRTVPVVFMAYDLLEQEGEDIRTERLSVRRERLDRLVNSARANWKTLKPGGREEIQGELFAVAGLNPEEPAQFAILLSPRIDAGSMTDLADRRREARARGAEGLMLKRLDSPYGVGRERGAWWKWKVDPHTIDAVMIAAQPGHGKRAGLFTDYTFGIWRDDELVSFAKAYSGLSADEIQAVDHWIRANTTGRHGPVRTVKPELVFELAFEGVQESSRHRSGLALRFPRISRWRKDKPAREADTVESLGHLLNKGVPTSVD